MPKKEYVKRDITMVGRTQPSEDGDKACEVCTDSNEFFSEAAKHDNRISYKKIEIDTPEGQDIAEDRDVRNIPYIKDCRTFEEGGKPRCREIEGFEPEDDFSDLQELIEKDKAKEPEPEVKEPTEPAEPKEEEEAKSNE
jgi:hypothetical protein